MSAGAAAGAAVTAAAACWRGSAPVGPASAAWLPAKKE
jgi:hypothetical protein